MDTPTIIIVDLYGKDGRPVRTGITFHSNDEATAKEQASEFATHHKSRGKTVKARRPKKKR
jgi:hypothetical protein